MSDNNNSGGKGRALGVVASIVLSLIVTFIIFVTIKLVL